jgi:hypothetical protein
MILSPKHIYMKKRERDRLCKKNMPKCMKKKKACQRACCKKREKTMGTSMPAPRENNGYLDTHRRE